MGLVQREIEQQGISTVSISLARNITEYIRPPRSYVLRYPFGHPLGEALHGAQQRQILRDVLDVLQSARTPATIVEAPYRWRRHRFQ